jgi:penicillin-binding protein 1A
MPPSPAAVIQSNPHGLPPGDEDEGLSPSSPAAGRLDDRRDRAPMLVLLWAAANQGTGRRAALSTPTFGKTGTTQNNRDALFIGFAGNLVVGVWVGHDDDRTLGKITGGTAPAEICGASWRRRLRSIGRRGPPLPRRLPRAGAARAIATKEEPTARRLERQRRGDTRHLPGDRQAHG